MVKKISEYGGMEKYSSKKAMSKHEGKESSSTEAGEKSMAMKKRGGGMATRGMGAALKKGGKVMKKAMGGGVAIGRRNPPALGQLPVDGSGGRRNPPALGKLPIKKAVGGVAISPIGRPGVGIGKPSGSFGGRQIDYMPGRGPNTGGYTGTGKGGGGRIIGGFKNGIDPSGRGVYDAAPPNVTRMKKGGMAKGRKGCK